MHSLSTMIYLSKLRLVSATQIPYADNIDQNQTVQNRQSKLRYAQSNKENFFFQKSNSMLKYLFGKGSLILDMHYPTRRNSSLKT